MSKIIPYMPKGKSFKYVDLNDSKMMQAKISSENSLDNAHQTGASIFIGDANPIISRKWIPALQFFCTTDISKLINKYGH